MAEKEFRLFTRANNIRQVGSGWPLVGRTEEIAEISGATSPEGPGGLVLAGAAGVGKTRLAREAIGLARRSGRPSQWIVATGSSRSVPLGAFAEYAGNFGRDPLRWVQDVIDALTAGAAPMSAVIGVDDAHLLDDLSALVVYQLVRRRLATVVLTLRTGAEVTEAVTSLWKDEGLPRVDLQPLSAGEITTLVTEALGGDVETASAERFWRLTRGNVLYLRQLIADEQASGRIRRRSELWCWDGHPNFSPTLLELIEANIGRQEPEVVDILDLLSVAEPLELNVLADLAPSDAVETAEARGVICTDTDVAGTATVRFSHPMFGEARRARLGAIRLRSLRGRVAAALDGQGEASPQRSVRRAVLMLGSDRTAEPELLLEAASAAMSLLDLRLAVSLTQSAVRCGGGRAARLAYGTALTCVANIGGAERVLRQLSETATDTEELIRVSVLRAGNLTWNACRSDAAALILEQAHADAGASDSLAAARVSCLAGAGRPAEAVVLADTLDIGNLSILDRMMLAWGLTAALGESGPPDRVTAAAADGYGIARSSPEASQWRFVLGVLHVHSLYLAGFLSEATATAATLRRESHEAEAALLVTATALGQAALHHGELALAQRWLREAIASGAEAAGGTGALVGVWQARALAMAGCRDDAQAELARVRVFEEFPLWEAERILTVAWVHAVSGVVSKAVAAVQDSARLLAGQGRRGAEVVALQYATQFGARNTADRLTELSSIVKGPRVVAASAHATAVRDGNAEGMLEASRLYEEFGDRIAAADAAAHAAVALRERGRVGSALSAAAVARRLAESCGAHTPAVQAALMPDPLTERQREIIALAATGLTNRQIAARLVMSVRTVEGHLFRASQRSGISSREGLIALLEGRATPKPPRRRATG
ncbi:LuxR family transcriptional regulator [soil metagenome]